MNQEKLIKLSMEQTNECEVRRIAKEHGIIVRKSKISGIYVTFADGEKEKFWGWKSILTHFVIFLDLKGLTEGLQSTESAQSARTAAEQEGGLKHA